jgi:leucyl aminopeptidase
MHTALVALGRTRVLTAAFALERPGLRELDDYYFGRASAEITGASLYRINDLKTPRRPRPPPLARILVGPVESASLPEVRRGLASGAALIESSALLRNLGNLPANICTPRYLANQARELERQYRRRLRVRIFDEAGIRRLKMGCFLAVTRGSEQPPRFIVLEYRGARRGRAPVVLVGKGVTFDTGGISLKDPPAMDEMKFDMCGAATVLAAIDYAARAELKINLVGLVPACENMPDAGAIKPGDIVTSASGQTVEILNTDAEGRLILCDALTYARRYSPEIVVDFATLTGACIVALGNHHSGVMGNDDALVRELVEAGVRPTTGPGNCRSPRNTANSCAPTLPTWRTSAGARPVRSRQPRFWASSLRGCAGRTWTSPVPHGSAGPPKGPAGARSRWCPTS